LSQEWNKFHTNTLSQESASPSFIFSHQKPCREIITEPKLINHNRFTAGVDRPVGRAENLVGSNLLKRNFTHWDRIPNIQEVFSCSQRFLFRNGNNLCLLCCVRNNYTPAVNRI